MSQIFTGKVVSTKMAKTVVVVIERKLRHPRYKKVMTRHNKIVAHNEDDSIKEGDMVTIRSTRPISKTKHFIVVSDTAVETKETVKPVKKVAVVEKKETPVAEKVEITEKKEVKKTIKKAVKPRVTTKTK